jgi:2-methylisocitrate lyase-like PEP mutase family enzyme
MAASLSTQKDKAEAFLVLHTAETPLILPNVWNPIGARILQAKGYPAVATASAAVSASLGYREGEMLKRSTTVDIHISYGPFVFRSCLRKFEEITDAMIHRRDHSVIGYMLTKNDTEEYLPDGPE